MAPRKSLLSFALLLVALAIPAHAQVPPADPDLWAYVFVPPLIDPELPFDVDVAVVNTAWGPANAVAVDLVIPAAAGFVDLPAGCEARTQQMLRCELDILPARSSAAPAERRFAIRAVAPEQRPGNPIVSGTLTVAPKENDADPSNNAAAFQTTMYRTFYVESPEPTGNDLRRAVERANGECTIALPCKIAFRIDPAGRPWVMLPVREALPPITGPNVWVDGSTQTRFFGDTNPVGPEIEIRASGLPAGTAGLVLESGCAAELRDLAVNGFPGAGIVAGGNDACLLAKEYLFGYEHRIRNAYVGTDPTGMVAIPNYRGIVVRYASPTHERDGLWSMWQIEDSIISGNARAGIFSESGTWRIARSRIGVNRDLSGDLGNGASGVYIGPRSHGTDVVDSYIMFNHEFGIAMDREVTSAAVIGGSFGGNWQGAIDIGLDGPTVAIGGSERVPSLQLPVITSAAWDPADGSTLVEGILPDPPAVTVGYRIAVYANDAPDPSGYGEGQSYLGTVAMGQDGRFALRHAGDLRGKWVAATATRAHYAGFAKPREIMGGAPPSSTGTFPFLTTTTEFSRVVEVK